MLDLYVYYQGLDYVSVEEKEEYTLVKLLGMSLCG